jgi:Fe-S-cluster containining protein
MPSIAPDAALPLTCTREGACCFGPQVWINPWELAVLARGLDLEPRLARQRLTDLGGLHLRHDGALDAAGRTACALYRPGHGCSAHAQRPLACRLFPLGRARLDGRPVYHHDPAGLPCLARCPGVTSLPQLTVAAYLRGQQVELHEAAHDAYAARCYGLVLAAATIARLEPGQRAGLLAAFAQLSALSPADRAALPGPGWTDVLTLLPAEAPLGQPAEAARQHAEAIAAAIAARHRDDLQAAGRAYLGLALRLAPAVGADAGAMRSLLEENSR